jgi:hypothetical protein
MRARYRKCRAIDPVGPADALVPGQHGFFVVLTTDVGEAACPDAMRRRTSGITRFEDVGKPMTPCPRINEGVPDCSSRRVQTCIHDPSARGGVEEIEFNGLKLEPHQDWTTRNRTTAPVSPRAVICSWLRPTAGSNSTPNILGMKAARAKKPATRLANSGDPGSRTSPIISLERPRTRRVAGHDDWKLRHHWRPFASEIKTTIASL